ncbi:MAG: sialidase family protein [Spirochaetia bacterium]
MDYPRFLATESDIFIGKRRRLKRYMVCPLDGYFPVAAKLGPQSIGAVFRSGATHIGVTGTLAFSRSDDGGKSWSDPSEVLPRWEDNRNPAFGVTGEGTLILAYWKAGAQSYHNSDTGPVWGSDKRKKRDIKNAFFIIRSTDGGKTWSEPEPFTTEITVPGSPYGRIITGPDGTCYMSMYGFNKDDPELKENVCSLLRSTDGGKTWGDETITAAGNHNETSYTFTPDGAMAAAVRSKTGHVAITRSVDAGRSWSELTQITRDGEHPADLTVLRSSRLLMTFGRRIRPMGCGALFSDDNGQTWDTEREVLLAGDGGHVHDVGYPSTIQLDDGTIVTLLYYANGSEFTIDGPYTRISCEAIHYREEDIRP